MKVLNLTAVSGNKRQLSKKKKEKIPNLLLLFCIYGSRSCVSVNPHRTNKILTITSFHSVCESKKLCETNKEKNIFQSPHVPKYCSEVLEACKLVSSLFQLFLF